MRKLSRSFYRNDSCPAKRAGVHRELQLTASEDHRALTRGKRKKRALMRNSYFDYSRWSGYENVQRSWKHRAEKRKQWVVHRLSEYECAILDRTRHKRRIIM